MPTDDGALVAGEPHSASTWYPANEHPRDKASYSFRISVPRGVEAIANGVLVGVEDRGGRSIWRWEAKEPMAAYLSTATIGQFDFDADGRWTPVRGRHRPRPAQARQAAHRRALRRDRHRAARLSSACCAGSTSRRAARSSRSPSASTRSRAATPSSWRRTRSAPTTGRRCATSGATPPPDDIDCRGALGASVPRALPAETARSRVRAEGSTGRWRGASCPRTTTSAGSSTSRATRAAASRSRSPTSPTTPSSLAASPSTTSWSRAPPARRRSRTTATRSTAGPFRARRRPASRTRPTGARPRSRRGRAGGRRRPGGARPPAGGHRLPGRALRAVPVLRGRLDRRRPS